MLGVNNKLFRRDFTDPIDRLTDFETYSITHEVIIVKMESHTCGSTGSGNSFRRCLIWKSDFTQGCMNIWRRGGSAVSPSFPLSFLMFNGVRKEGVDN